MAQESIFRNTNDLQANIMEPSHGPPQADINESLIISLWRPNRNNKLAADQTFQAILGWDFKIFEQHYGYFKYIQKHL